MACRPAAGDRRWFTATDRHFIDAAAGRNRPVTALQCAALGRRRYLPGRLPKLRCRSVADADLLTDPARPLLHAARAYSLFGATCALRNAARTHTLLGTRSPLIDAARPNALTGAGADRDANANRQPMPACRAGATGRTGHGALSNCGCEARRVAQARSSVLGELR